MDPKITPGSEGLEALRGYIQGRGQVPGAAPEALGRPRRKGKLSKLQQERALLQQTFQARTGAVIEKFRGARQSPAGGLLQLMGGGFLLEMVAPSNPSVVYSS